MLETLLEIAAVILTIAIPSFIGYSHDDRKYKVRKKKTQLLAKEVIQMDVLENELNIPELCATLSLDLECVKDKIRSGVETKDDVEYLTQKIEMVQQCILSIKLTSEVIK